MSQQRSRTTYICESSCEVQYSFVCEKCGKTTPNLTHTFKGTENAETGYLNRLSQTKIESLTRKAQSSLNIKIDASRNGKSYPYDDKCPTCRAYQSWGLLTAKKKLIYVLIVCGLGILFSLFLFLGPLVSSGGFTIEEFSIVDLVFGGFGIVVISILLFLSLKAVVSYRKRLISVGDVKEKQIPIAFWDTLSEVKTSIRVEDYDSIIGKQVHRLDELDTIGEKDSGK